MKPYLLALLALFGPILANVVQTYVQEWLRKRGMTQSHQQIAERVVERVIEVTSNPRIPVASPIDPPPITPRGGEGTGS